VGAVAVALVSLTYYQLAYDLGGLRLAHPIRVRPFDQAAADYPPTNFRKSSEKEKGGIREEVDAAV
jgi:hypothetical protein|tara:strand:- start:660 stop:857 length:198 start_codon:yes stop_codon:yes gene_type:complete